MLALLSTARRPAVMVLLLVVVALMIVGLYLAGQALDDVGSWRWASGRPA